jgi:hypothetical protein
MFSSVLGSEMPTTKEALHSRTLGRLPLPILPAGLDLVDFEVSGRWHSLPCWSIAVPAHANC